MIEKNVFRVLGHSFICPDMVGGGSAKTFLKGSHFDAPLSRLPHFVRESHEVSE